MGGTVVDELGGEGVAQLMRRNLDATELPPTCDLIAHGFTGEQAAVVAPQMVVGAGRPLHNIEVEAVRQGRRSVLSVHANVAPPAARFGAGAA
jgi:hypothetical protein